MLLNQYIAQKRMCEFVGKLIEIKDDEMIWDIWLHKVQDKSYEEFKNLIYDMQQQNGLTKEQVETTVKESENILTNFNPNERGD